MIPGCSMVDACIAAAINTRSKPIIVLSVFFIAAVTLASAIAQDELPIPLVRLVVDAGKDYLRDNCKPVVKITQLSMRSTKS